MKKIISLLILVLFSQLAFADDPTTSQAGANLFSIPLTDISVNLLAVIFGVVDGVLHGTGSQILGNMFGVFNAAVLSLGIIILGYTVFAGILKTAHEGEALGRQWSSIWIPLRSAAGIGLLIPKASGYCAIQIFIMWVVIQGVGAADAVWKAALSYLARGGVVIQQTKSPMQQGATRLVGSSSAVLSSLVCMHELEYQLKQQQQNSSTPTSYGTVPSFSSTLVIQPTSTSIQIPGDLSAYPGFSPLTGTCGEITWSTEMPLPNYMYGDNKSGGTVGDSSNVLPQYQGLAKMMQDSKAMAVQQMVLDLDPIAQDIVNNYHSATPMSLGQLLTGCSGGGQVWGGYSSTGTTSTCTSPTPALFSGTELAYASADYLNIVYPAMHAVTENPQDLQFIAKAAAAGWIMAGSFYFDITQLNNSTTARYNDYYGFEPTPPATNFNDPNASVGGDDNNVLISNGYFSADSTYLNSLNQLINCSDLGQVVADRLGGKISISNGSGCTPPVVNTYLYGAVHSNPSMGYLSGNGNKLQAAINSVGNFSATTVVGVDKLTGVQNLMPPATTISGDMSFAKASFTGKYKKDVKNSLAPLGGVIEAFSDLASAQQKNINPVIAMAEMGSSFISITTTVWIGSATIMSSLAVSLGSIPFTTVSNAVNALVGWVSPFLMAVLATLFMTGAALAYLNPLLPFILFTMGSIGWLIAVIEAMTAGPLVALGIAHPEGHEILGKSEPAAMLIAQVFLRPSLMIIGLIAGIILSYVGVWLINYGFYHTLIEVMSDVTGSISSVILTPIALAVIYTILCVGVIYKSFVLINKFPDEILRYLQGGHGTTFGQEANQAVEQVKGNFGQAAQQAGQGISAVQQDRERRQAEKGDGSKGGANKIENT